jgi:hypothetical protein
VAQAAPHLARPMAADAGRRPTRPRLVAAWLRRTTDRAALLGAGAPPGARVNRVSLSTHVFLAEFRSTTDLVSFARCLASR